MGREVRMVPADWEHPKMDNGRYEPLHDGYERALADFAADIEKMGLGRAVDYWGGGPVSHDYMLVGVPAEKRTHFMMYEDTTEGTPISPAFETPEELARWLADTGASAFGGQGASYEGWLATCKGGYAPSGFYSPQTGLISGVDAAVIFGEKVED